MSKMSDCTHDCKTCGQTCSDRKEESLLAPLNELSSVKKVIAVVSGKGGVGKSTVTSLLAVSAQRKGFHSAILDADITGPSVPKAFGIHEKATGNEQFIYPVKSKSGIDIMSLNLLLESDTTPVVWRGPILAGTVKQFWSDVVWDDVDYMFVDMPPGTGDVPLTVFQSIPVDGIIIVTTPQQLVSMIVEKAVNMANMMNIPILGSVENMSYFKCPDCGSKHFIYGESRVEEIASRFGIKAVAKIPIDTKLTSACDNGMIELADDSVIKNISDTILI